MAETVIDPTKDREAFLNQPWVSDPVIAAYKQHIDRTLLRANLKLTPEERLRKAMALQQFAEELRTAGRRSRHAVPDVAAPQVPDFIPNHSSFPAREGG